MAFSLFSSAEKNSEAARKIHRYFRDLEKHATGNLNYVLNGHEDEADYYLAILKFVFDIDINAPSLADKTAKSFNILDLVKTNLTKNSETTAISFIVFTNRLLNNETVVQELRTRGLLELSDSSDDLTQSLNQLQGYLSLAMDYRANHAEFSYKMFGLIMATLAALGIAIMSIALGGPVGIVLGAGVVGAIAGITVLLSGILSPNRKEEVNHQLEMLKEDFDEIISSDTTIFSGFNALIERDMPQSTDAHPSHYTFQV